MADVTFTGERFLPTCTGEIAYEHWHRYAFARRFVVGKRVLDAACGEGYGTALLSKVASTVVGVDIDAATIAHARAHYGAGAPVTFVEGSCTTLPLTDASIDVVVSFETVEHLREADQSRMLLEFSRVLVPEGLLVISSPNKRLYSDERSYVNEFHLHELYRDSFSELLTPAFPAQRWYHQRVATWSGIWPEIAAVEAEGWIADAGGVVPYTGGEGMYFVVVAARCAETLPPAAPLVSLLADAEDSEGKRAAFNAREVLRLDALLKASNETVQQQSADVLKLEKLVADRDQRLEHTTTLLTERDRVVTVLQSEIARLHEEVNGKERLVTYRQSFRWWVTLPWMRLRLWLEARL